MIPDTDRITSVAAVLIMVALVVTALPAAADVTSTDTSTTDDTSSQSQLVDEDTIEDLDGTQGENGSAIIQVIADNSTVNPVMEVETNATGNIAARNASMANVTQSVPHSEGSHFNATLQNSSLASVEHSINANVTMNVAFYNNSSDTSVDHRQDLYLNFTNATTTQNVNDADVDNDTIVTVSDEDGPFGINAFGLGSDQTEIDTDERKVDGQTTDVVIVLSNSSVADDYDSAVSSDTEDGDALFTMPLSVRSDDTDRDKLPVVVYHEEAPSDVDEDDDTYAVYTEDHGGEAALVVNLGSEYEDADTVEVKTLGGVDFVRSLEHRIATSSVGLTLDDANPLNMSPAFGTAAAATPLIFAASRRRKGAA